MPIFTSLVRAHDHAIETGNRTIHTLEYLDENGDDCVEYWICDPGQTNEYFLKNLALAVSEKILTNSLSIYQCEVFTDD